MQQDKHGIRVRDQIQIFTVYAYFVSIDDGLCETQCAEFGVLGLGCEVGVGHFG